MINTSIFNENLELTINDLLNLKEENFKLFKFFFTRILELCEREAGNKNIEEYSNGLKCLTLKEVESLMQSQQNYSIVQSHLNISSNTFNWSLAVLHAAYKYCFYQNPMSILMGLSKTYDMQHILTALFALEDITSHHNTTIVHNHLLEKYKASEKIKKSEHARNIAQIRHAKSKKNDENNLTLVKEIWDKNNWRTYTECAESILRRELLEGCKYRKIYDLVSKAAKQK